MYMQVATDDETTVSDAGAIMAIQRLTTDLRRAATTLAPHEVRWLVRLYYEMQEQRIRAASQMRTSEAAEEPNALVQWMLGNYATLENDIRRAMDAYSHSKITGQWLRSVVGIGPVLAAGLMAYVDIERTPSASHLWSFAGLNPTQSWTRGEKRPWNAQLKVLCWKCGQSFVKSSGNARSYYGPIYRTRKQQEQERNEAGVYADQACAALTAKRIGEETVARQFYVQGKLPPAHIQARAERYAVKLFLSHYWTVAYETYYGRSAPRPYPIEHGGHVDYIPPPNWPLIP